VAKKRGLLASILVAVALAALVSPAAAATPRPPTLDARAWLLIDARDGARLAAKAPRRELPIASTTKLMTAKIVLEELSLGKHLRVSGYDAAPAEVVLGLQAGERISVRDLLSAMLISSANDAAVALAEGASGSVEAFVGEMNREARRLGLDQTRFSNPIGFDSPENHSSARDLATLTSELKGNKTFREIVARRGAQLRSGGRKREITTRNALLARLPWVDGVKTGRTTDAGYVLVSSGSRKGVPLIAVVLGAPSEAARDAESLELLKYGFSLYESRVAVPTGSAVAKAEVEFGDASLALLAARPVEVTARGDQVVETVIDSPAEVRGPIKRRERLGEVVVTVDGEPSGSTPLVAARAVEAPGFLDKLGNWVPAPLAGVGALLLLVGILAARRSRRRTRDRKATADRQVQRPPGRQGQSQ